MASSSLELDFWSGGEPPQGKCRRGLKILVSGGIQAGKTIDKSWHLSAGPRCAGLLGSSGPEQRGATGMNGEMMEDELRDPERV
jgi:hypothetical protein